MVSMRCRRRILPIWSALVAACLTARAGENYLLFAVSTDLQHALLSPGINAYAVIYANGVIQNGTIDATSLELDALRSELRELAQSGNDAIAVYLRFENWTAMPEAEKQLADTIKGLCRDAGYRSVVIGQQYAGSGWWKAKQSAQAGTELGDEPSAGDERVRVYPVRTALSRFLTSNADCVVEIRQPFDGREQELPLATRRSIAECIAKLKITNKAILQFRVSSTKAGEPAVRRFTTSDGTAPSGAEQFARQIGFDSTSVSHTPTGGAPESLIDKTPPRFKLEGLDGQLINLEEHIQGKVALITFWGLACGPCRREAPHLSAAFEKYKDRGFTVVAVNAYDDDKDAVTEYVQSEQLQHPIALKGEQVAREAYSVGAFPTSFWVDHHGKVIDYVVGFDPGDEAQIAARIERLLKARNESAR